MRHIALVYCDEDFYPVPEFFEELMLRHRLHIPEFYIFVREGRTRPIVPLEGWNFTSHTNNSTALNGQRRKKRHTRSNNLGENMVERIREITRMHDTVLHMLITGEIERASALAISAFLLYGRPHDCLYWWAGKLEQTPKGRISISSILPMSPSLVLRAVPCPPMQYVCPDFSTLYEQTAHNGVDHHAAPSMEGNVPPSAVLDVAQCTVRVGENVIPLSPVECALYWWVVHAHRPIPWGKSLQDDDWEQFCELYRLICNQRNLARTGNYTPATPFGERLQVLQKAVSTIKRKISALGPSAAELYAPQPIGLYAEKALHIRATIELR
ncbi:MAG: hypothetical protein D6747_01360 [Chlorobiota bacterium]|jgi:hypothetical protein|nr:MAG: hypothetical protein D6747_01360 [Chlorobiota bacterium]